MRASWVGLSVLGCVACGAPAAAPVPDALERCDGPAGSGPVAVNEVTSSEDDRVELANLSPLAVDLSGWWVTDSGCSELHRYRIPDGTLLPGDGYLVLRKGSHHAFDLGSADAVTLYDPAGRPVSAVTWTAGQAAASLCRKPDRTGAFTSCTASFGAPNVKGGGELAPAWVFGQGADHPDEVGYGADGHVWFGTEATLSLTVVDAEAGTLLRTLGGPGDARGRFHRNRSKGKDHGPQGVRPFGQRVYAVDRDGGRLNVYDAAADLAPLPALVVPGLSNPKGLEVDGEGRLYIADEGAERVVVVDATAATGAVLATFGGPGETPNAEAVAIDAARGRLLVTTRLSDAAGPAAARIACYDLASGQHLGWIGEQAPTPRPGRFVEEVEGIAVDASRAWLLAVDERGGRVVVFDLASPSLFEAAADFGAIGAIGRSGSGPAELNGADGIVWIPSRDLLVVADQNNDRLQAFRMADVAAALGR